ncbi:transglycosylase SLT domain-containing protein [Clostridium aestuarii]|uniref:Transglycosylase SLT domain-containing protein n=1 Tax=Clostridium aestuarii TaxID=338193 RepID=A0ABT4D3I9_9CLOT|nr:transglycosylase SLT domain-containing protein [Clostridium aestuarii]MCY6485803.1 transglycosylase SLT domain-containing protein [Clostridium aestuarii]
MKQLIGILAVILIILAVGTSEIKNILFPLKFKADIIKFSKKYGIDPYLLTAIINIESGFTEVCYRKGKKSGIMQIREETAERWIKEMKMKNFKVKDLGSPSISIKIGAWYLGQLKNKNNDMYSILEGWVNRHAQDGYMYTQDIKKRYLNKIKLNLNMYKVIYIGMLR